VLSTNPSHHLIFSWNVYTIYKKVDINHVNVIKSEIFHLNLNLFFILSFHFFLICYQSQSNYLVFFFFDLTNFKGDFKINFWSYYVKLFENFWSLQVFVHVYLCEMLHDILLDIFKYFLLWNMLIDGVIINFIKKKILWDFFLCRYI
jgi:hypothetical protein